MLNNYNYFLVLAEELNISRAAEKLLVSHQCLSKYLKNLEDEYGVMLFQRKPAFALTHAGETVRDAFRRIEMIDTDLSAQIRDLSGGKTGEVRVGTTQGRMRILMPELLDRFKKRYPNIELRIVSSTTGQLLEMLANNKLDVAIFSDLGYPLPHLRRRVILQEHLYLVISDNMIREYFPGRYPACLDEFAEGADLREFGNVPFVRNSAGFSSRIMTDRHLIKIGASLKCVNEATAMDLHHLMTARDYAASFALTMYLPSIEQLSRTGVSNSPMYVFPIKGLDETNPVIMVCSDERNFPEYVNFALKEIAELCASYAKEDADISRLRSSAAEKTH
ncbi:MAG: LysR substrate-binding domain-containing protein [Pyramidobacter sp.]|jgi:DNA-binding transcriptional LysR family regulator